MTESITTTKSTKKTTTTATTTGPEEPSDCKPGDFESDGIQFYVAFRTVQRPGYDTLCGKSFNGTVAVLNTPDKLVAVYERKHFCSF